MIGAIVSHPLFGRGQVLELRNAARESVVRFDNGIRTVVPTSMLTMLHQAAESATASSLVAASPPPRLTEQPRAEIDFTPEQQQRLEARRTIEALRFGVVPHHRICELSFGLDEERRSLHQAFDAVEQTGGDVRVVLGEYGTGKSHFFELAIEEALARNFIVAATSLDVREVPPNRPQRIYNALIRSLRYPDSPDRGTLTPLFDRLLNPPAVYAGLSEKLRGTTFATVLHNYSLLRGKSGEALEPLLDWISGEKVYIKSVRDALLVKNQDYPVRALSMMTTSADQYCYLLNGWGWLASQVGYAGLAVLLDESEHYSLLNQRGQERADNFFKALIYTAMASRKDNRVSEASLQHQRHEHPFRFAERSQMLLMFAVTPSANTFDYRRWLHDEQILPLAGHLSDRALEELMTRLYALHQQAYSYERENACSTLAKGVREGMEQRLINLRQTIRLATEVFDLCYAYPDYSAAQAVEEFRRSLFGRQGVELLSSLDG
ncbi:MAG: BREX system ATP-binding domain-containing protein [Blastocatellia bacterium]